MRSLPGLFRRRALLGAPTAESKDHVTLAGVEVSANGQWTPGPPEKLAVETNIVRLQVPHASAVLLQLQRN